MSELDEWKNTAPNTLKIDWADFGYGYFDVYEKNPYGIVADSAEEFFGKLHESE